MIRASGGSKVKKRKQSVLAVLLFFAFLGFQATGAMSAEVPRISKEDLKTKLDDPGMIILDVRTNSDWKASEFKIKGAIRVSSENVDSWASKYAKDETLVLYCA
jgi:predicted sulfurtransferase